MSESGQRLRGVAERGEPWAWSRPLATVVSLYAKTKRPSLASRVEVNSVTTLAPDAAQ